MSFWQYQISQEHSFQQAVVRNLNEKNIQFQKQLDNTIREANSEISLLNDKANQLECDLETERRRTRELQDESREREKEYQKLKVLLDKFKRKALLAPAGSHQNGSEGESIGVVGQGPVEQLKHRGHRGQANASNPVSGIEAQGFRRMPLANRTQFAPQAGSWNPQIPQAHVRSRSNRQPFSANDRGNVSGYASASESADEVENLLTEQRPMRSSTQSGWSTTTPRYGTRPPIQGFTPQTGVRKFRPAPLDGLL